MATDTITSTDILEMVRHWLHTPINGYLGSGYGQDIKSLLQLPHSDSAADDYLEKLKNDVPILKALPEGSVNIYGVHTPPDRLDFVIEIMGMTLDIPVIT